MTFTDGYRVERVYFERLKSLITILKSLKDGVQDETVRTLIENAIDSDGAILLLYRNLGEAWAELADQVQKTRKMLQDLDEKTENYHDELNERIDEVNNYLMALIRALEARMDAVEADLAQMGRLFTYDLNRVNDEYTLTESGQAVTWAGTVEKVQHVRPHFVTVRGLLDGEVTYLMPREYDTALASGIFEWYSVGFVGNEIHEVTVTLLPDDSVNVAIHTTDFASILLRLTTAENNITRLQGRMDNAETDIDNLELTAENHEERLEFLEDNPYIINVSYTDLVANDQYLMKHNNTSITMTDIEAAIDAGKIPLLIFTKNASGDEEIYKYNRHDNIGFAQFENIQRRVDANNQGYYVNAKFSAQGNFALYSEDSLGDGGKFVIDLSYDTDNEVYICKHDNVVLTPAAFDAALSGEKNVVVRLTNERRDITFDLNYCGVVDTGLGKIAYFTCTEIDGATTGLTNMIYHNVEISYSTSQGNEYIDGYYYITADYLIDLTPQGNVDIMTVLPEDILVTYFYITPDMVDSTINYYTALQDNKDRIHISDHNNLKGVVSSVVSGKYIDGVYVYGIRIKITDFTFTNNVLNTRELFIYGTNVVEWA